VNFAMLKLKHGLEEALLCTDFRRNIAPLDRQCWTGSEREAKCFGGDSLTATDI